MKEILERNRQYFLARAEATKESADEALSYAEMMFQKNSVEARVWRDVSEWLKRKAQQEMYLAKSR